LTVLRYIGSGLKFVFETHTRCQEQSFTPEFHSLFCITLTSRNVTAGIRFFKMKYAWVMNKEEMYFTEVLNFCIRSILPWQRRRRQSTV